MLYLLLCVLAVSEARPDALSEFAKRIDRRIAGHDTRTYCGVSVEECARRCKVDYNCRSFEYEGNCCRTSEASTETNPGQYEVRRGTDYYELKPGAWLDYYTEHKNRRLQNAHFQVLCTSNNKPNDCARKCMQSPFLCRAFDFDHSSGCCYLHDQTRSTSPIVTSTRDFYEVKAGTLSDYFEVQPNYQLANYNNLVLCSVSVDDCRQRCLQETSFDCASFDFLNSWGCCYLSSADRTTAASSFQSTSGTDYYQVKTGYRWRPDGRCGAGYSADLATPAQCNPDGDYCCVGTTCESGSCTSGTDYRGWNRCGERECTCSASDKRVNCNSRSLSYVDFFIPRSTRYLDLSSNSLITVPVASLAGLNELTTLDLSGNNINTLPQRLTDDLSSLQTLKLNNNPMNDFDIGIALTAPTLRNMYLSSNTRVRFTWAYLPEIYPGVNCPFSNCYSPCGDPSYLNGPQDWSRLQAHLVIKKLYFDLADLFSYVSDVTQSVTIYAHTVVTSADVSFDFDLTINTRQLWTMSGHLSFAIPSGQHSGPMVTCGRLDNNWQQVNINIGNRLKINMVTNESYAMPYPCSQTASTALSVQADRDLLGLTVQCARLLADSHDLSDPRSLPMRMLDWTIAQSRRGGPAGVVHPDAVQAKLELTLSAEGYHYVPYMSMAVYQNILSSYYSQINVYRQEYNRLMDRTQAVEIRLEAARQVLARVDDVTRLQEQDLGDLEQEIERTKQTRAEIKIRFEESKVELDSARQDFEEGIEQYKQEQAAKAAFGFLKAIVKIFTFGAGGGDGPDDDEIPDINSLIGGVTDIVTTMNNLVILFRQLANFDAILETTLSAIDEMSTGDYEGYMLDVQQAADLHVSLVEWANLKAGGDVLLSHGGVQKIRGSGKYRRALSDTSQWGKGLSEQTISLAQLMVQYHSGQRWLQASKREKERIQAQLSLDESRREISLETEAAAGMQAFQVKLGMNNILLDYCGSYFYFQFRQCGNNYKPNLSDDMVTLLQKISNANRDALASLGSFTRLPQPFDDIQVHLADSINADDCQGVDSCPIDQFKRTGILSFTLDINNPTFTGWDRVRIERIRAYIRGADNSGSHLRVAISTSGEFADRYQGNSYQFASLPVKRQFEYRPNGLPGSDIIVDGEVHQSFSGYFYQTTPFTTWVIRLAPELNPGLDLSGVTHIELHFKGSVVTNYRGAEVPSSMVIQL